MLGTAFFRDTGLKYAVQDWSHRPGKEHARNGLWVRTISQIPVPVLSQKGTHVEDGSVDRKPIGAKTTVNLLQLSFAQGIPDAKKTVRDDMGPINIRCSTSMVGVK